MRKRKTVIQLENVNIFLYCKWQNTMKLTSYSLRRDKYSIQVFYKKTEGIPLRRDSPMVQIIFLSKNTKCLKSRIMHALGTMLGYNLAYTHVAVRVILSGIDIVYEYTDRGVTCSSVAEINGLEALPSITYRCDINEVTGVLNRIDSVVQQKTRLSWLDLCRVAFRKEPKGLTCVTFLQYVLGEPVQFMTPVQWFITWQNRLWKTCQYVGGVVNDAFVATT